MLTRGLLVAISPSFCCSSRLDVHQSEILYVVLMKCCLQKHSDIRKMEELNLLAAKPKQSQLIINTLSRNRVVSPWRPTKPNKNISIMVYRRPLMLCHNRADFTLHVSQCSNIIYNTVTAELQINSHWIL